MKKRVDMIVQSVREIALDTFEMTLQNAETANTAKPGQFLYLSVEGHTLRRPISIADADPESGTVTILFKTTGDGTKHLSMFCSGMNLDVIGPTGNGFYCDAGTVKTALLIGGGIGVPPLYYLGKELRKNGIGVITVLGFQSKEYVFYEEMFQEFGKAYVATNDGSYGYQGYVTDILDQVGHFDHYYSCGPISMLRAITSKLRTHSGSISLEERMGCGIGACFACVIPADNEGGYRKICTDGPVFAAGEVRL
ncbi:dihydroorotate dehydrogenase electron transfer subunit [Lentibacillus halodurans]|uniref:Dihydroorotate dehydrogenase B (NAD(+)), electron transfer subunit n=1 Tax=Lentibacillus halodurans TaxID=237679 RepID=A0A1I0Z2L8_9BACI|nr:dihydroorotate dehydrogenase electron transfer subunit [Lentibacillus halodurans]SFB19346.1 dihydroorotate dehydrogenase electron transfer subunit [Lentibacillus halodurans]